MISINKLKVISLLSSAMLWFYVVAIVNPSSTSSMENLPVSISNMVELSENRLILSSDSKPTINITLEGNISDLRRLKKENVRASIEIQNPSEGKNEATIHVSVPNNIKYSLEEETIVVQLEKTISKEYNISLELPSNKDVSDYNVVKSIDSVRVSGPRSAITRVHSLVATIKEDNFELNRNIGVQLKAVDIKGNIVENATLENSIIQIRLNKIEQKEVYVEPVFSSSFDKKDVLVNPTKIVIYGEQSILDTIDKVYTSKVNVKDLKANGSILVELELPDGVSTVKNISIEDLELKNEVEISLIK